MSDSEEMPRLNLETRRRVIILKQAGFSFAEIKKRLGEEDIPISLQALHNLVNRGVGSYFGLVRQVSVYGNTTIVCEAHCMRSMPKLGGSGGMPPRKILKNRY